MNKIRQILRLYTQAKGKTFISEHGKTESLFWGSKYKARYGKHVMVFNPFAFLKKIVNAKPSSLTAKKLPGKV